MLNQRLRELRKKAKYTQQELSEKIGVPLTTYANWEQGTRHPDYDVLVKLANIFYCSTDFLLGRTNDEAEILNKPSPDEALVVVAENSNVPPGMIKDYIEYLKNQNKKD